MKNLIFKTFVISMITLFLISDLQAQYTVFQVTGVVEMSIDGKTWTPLKKKDELKDFYQIKTSANAVLQIVDANNFIFNYSDSKIVSVSEILKQRKSIFTTINEDSNKRDVIGGVERGQTTITDKENIRLRFHVEEIGWYDDYEWDLIPEESIFYILIVNNTEENKTVNVYQKIENETLIPCFPENIRIEKNTSFGIEELLFMKQAKNSLIVVSE